MSSQFPQIPFPQILPSSYSWLLPNYDYNLLDDLALKGEFPVLADLIIPSLIYAFLFGIARHILTALVFQVFYVLFIFFTLNYTYIYVDLYCTCSLLLDFL